MDFTAYTIAGIRNKPGRNLATVFCFAFIAANMFSAQYLTTGTVGSVDRGISRMGADLLVVPVQYSALYYRETGPENTAAIVKAEATNLRMKNSTLTAVGNVPGVLQATPQLYAGTVQLPESSTSVADVFGIDPATDFTIRPWLRDPLARPPGPGDVILGSNISGTVSSTITVRGSAYTVAGRLEPTGTSVDRTLFLRMEDAYALTGPGGIVSPTAPRIQPGDINAVLVRLEPGADPDLVAARIMQPSAAITVIGKHFALGPASREAAGLRTLLTLISIVVVLAAFPLITLISAMVAHERRREIGLLRAMGATRKNIVLLVVAEALVLAAAGGFTGVGGSLVFFRLLDSAGLLPLVLPVPYTLPSLMETVGMAAVACTGVCGIGTLAALYPAYLCASTGGPDAGRAGKGCTPE